MSIVGVWLALAMQCERGLAEVRFQDHAFYLTTIDSPIELYLANGEAKTVCGGFN